MQQLPCSSSSPSKLLFSSTLRVLRPPARFPTPSLSPPSSPTPRFSFSRSLSWTDWKLLRALEGAPVALRVGCLKVSSRHAASLSTGNSNDKQRRSRSSPRKDRAPESASSTKSPTIIKTLLPHIASSREIQAARTDTARKQNKVTIKGSVAREGESSTAAEGGNLKTEGSTQKASLEVPDIQEKARVRMESTNNQNGENSVRMSKRAKKNSEEVKTLLEINMCSKNADLHGALEIFDKVKREGVFKLRQQNYNVLLYICSGAASGSLSKGKSGSKQINKGVQKPEAVMETDVEPSLLEDGTPDSEEVRFSPQEMELASRRGLEIYEDMLQAEVPPNEATFTAIARLANSKGDGDLAFEMVKKMAAANIAPKLRSYGPALLSFCERNEVRKAFEVDDHMLAAGILPDESLLEALLKASMEAGLEDKVYSLLQRLRTTVKELSVKTVETIESWFNSEVAASAGKTTWDKLLSNEELTAATEAGGGGWHGLGWLGRGKWKVRRTTMNKMGSCLTCGEQLCTIDLDPQETENFANSVAELACQREKNSDDFKAFQTWLDKNGPFDAIMDGANIGLYNPSLSKGFNFPQVNALVQAIRAKNSSKRFPLVILHRRRTTDGPALSAKAQPLIKSWMQANALFATPLGSNDDWYWLYAAVKCKCLLVTNDEMRDHIFELLGNDFFPKWKERHQVRFTVSAKGLELHMPPPYSIVMQESQNGSWHIPQIGGDDINSPREWLCVTRPASISFTDTHISPPDDLTTALEVEFVNSKLLTENRENSLDEVGSLSSFQKRAKAQLLIKIGDSRETC